MKICDNFDKLSIYFNELKSPEDFYFVQIIQRKKDGIKLPSYTSGARTIRSFYFFNKEHFLEQKEYIKELCRNNKARAYFWINPRNTVDVACESIKQFAELIQSGNTKQGVSVYDRVVGSSRSPKYDKLWIVDLDSKDTEYKSIIISLIEECRPEVSKVVDIIPTVNGYHVITTKFDKHQFQQKLAIQQLDSLDIHIDNPTLLYYEQN